MYKPGACAEHQHQRQPCRLEDPRRQLRPGQAAKGACQRRTPASRLSFAIHDALSGSELACSAQEVMWRGSWKKQTQAPRHAVHIGVFRSP